MARPREERQQRRQQRLDARDQRRAARQEARGTMSNPQENRGFGSPTTGRFKDGREYDSRTAGRKGFNSQDIDYLRKQGRSDAEIKDVASQLKDRLGEGAQSKLGLYDVPETLENYDPYQFGNKRVRRGQVKPGENGRPDISGREARMLVKEGGFSAQEVNDMIKDRGFTVGASAQKFLNKRLASMTGNPPTDVTATPDEPFIDTKPVDDGGTLPTTTPEKPEDTTMPLPTPNTSESTGAGFVGNTQTQGDLTVGSDKFNDSPVNNQLENVDVYGNYTGGHQDFSINIGTQTQNMGGGGGTRGAMGFSDLGLDNIASAATTHGLLENALARSQSSFSGMGRAAAATAAAGNLTGSRERIAGLDYRSRLSPHEMRAHSDGYTLGAFGDVYNQNFANRNMGGFEFARPDAPALPDFDAEELAEKAREGLK